jgi:regulator of sigma E protease
VPVLDGGMILFFLIEIIAGRPISIKKREMAQKIGLFVLLLLMVFVFYNDLLRILTE